MAWDHAFFDDEFEVLVGDEDELLVCVFGGDHLGDSDDDDGSVAFVSFVGLDYFLVGEDLVHLFIFE